MARIGSSNLLEPIPAKGSTFVGPYDMTLTIFPLKKGEKSMKIIDENFRV